MNYYEGGLAELVSMPSELTYTFLAKWFTGQTSLGSAMKLLGLPFEKINDPVLKMHDGMLVVDLDAEEKTLYANTVFGYRTSKDSQQGPQLGIKWPRVINPIAWKNTLQILLVQSKWIAKPESVVRLAEKIVGQIPEQPCTHQENIDTVLAEQVWPGVVAIGLLCEFFSHLVVGEKKLTPTSSNYMAAKMRKNDWFFKSISDQGEVRRKKLSFEEYLHRYGLRADQDYELTSSRWCEIPEVIKKRIQNYSEKESVQKLAESLGDERIETLISLTILRSEAKRKALIHFNALRQSLPNSKKTLAHKKTAKKETKPSPVSGQGVTVSSGVAQGRALHILDNDMAIPDQTIGIFSNSSPEFAPQYPKCSGMIFLKGGITSHGAIVAREYGIPAIIDNSAQDVANGVGIRLDADAGSWEKVGDILGQ